MDYFSPEEMKQHDGTPYPAEWLTDETRWPKLLTALNRIRQEVGKPIRVLSGYRSVEYNAAMYQAQGKVPTNSQHSQGRAADITWEGMNATEMRDLVLRLYKAGEIEIGGLGRYVGQSFIHVDVREQEPPGHLAQWDG